MRRHEFQILVKTQIKLERKLLHKNIQKFVSIWLKKLQTPFDLKVSIDIDPYNFS